VSREANEEHVGKGSGLLQTFRYGKNGLRRRWSCFKDSKSGGRRVTSQRGLEKEEKDGIKEGGGKE